MNKVALTVDPNVVSRHALGGLMVGGSTAALVNLLHAVNQARNERKAKMQSLQTDENTIVLTLPPKSAEITGKAVQPKVEAMKAGDYTVQRDKSQSRESGNGRYGPRLVMGEKSAEPTGWPTLTASGLAALGGGSVGAAIINKLYEVQRERRLKAELEAAQNEYMDLLGGKKVKGASIVEDMFWDDDGDEKQADSAFGMLNYPMAAIALMTILGSGATGYLTKQVLDQKLKDTQDQGKDIPKVKRIVFQTAPAQDPQKLASAEDGEAVLGSLMLMMDKVGGTERFVGDPEVKAAADKAGITKQALLDQTQNINQAWGMLLGQPELRKALYRVGVDYTSKGPGRFFKQVALSTPMGMRHADQKAMGWLQQLRQRGLSSKAHYGTLLSEEGRRPIHPMTNINAPMPKLAQDLSPLVTAGAGFLGTGVAKELLADKMTPEQLAQLIVSAQDDVKHQRLLKDTKVPDTIQIHAKDPNAAQFLGHNAAKIQAITRRLAAEGQV